MAAACACAAAPAELAPWPPLVLQAQLDSSQQAAARERQLAEERAAAADRLWAGKTSSLNDQVGGGRGALGAARGPAGDG